MSQDELDAARWREVLKRARFSRVSGMTNDNGQWLIHIPLKGSPDQTLQECLDALITTNLGEANG